MKTINNSLFLMAALSLFAVSCSDNLSKEAPEDSVKLVPMTFSVEGEATKSSLNADGRTVDWSAGDMVALFDDVNGRVAKAFTIADGKIEAEVSEGSTEFYGLYPYNASASINGNVLTTNIPTEQTAVEGSFGEEVNVAMAYTTVADKHLSFKNTCALVQFTLSISDVVSVTLTSNDETAMSGETSLSFSAGAVAGVNCNGAYSVKLAKADGSALTSGAVYYMALAPRTYSSGITMTLVKSDGTVLVRKGASSLALSLNTIKPLGTLSADNFTACNGLYEAYKNVGMPLEICGQLYTESTLGALGVVSESLQSNLHQKNGVVFLASGADLTLDSNFNVKANQTLVIASNNPANPATISTKATKGGNLNGGSTLCLKNLNLVFAESSATYLMAPNNGIFSKFYIEGCNVTATSTFQQNLFMYSSNASNGGESIRLKGNTIRMDVSKALFGFNGATTAKNYNEIIVEDNVLYSTEGINIQVFSMAGTDDGTGSVDISVKNNIFYNIQSTGGLFQHYLPTSVTITGNIYVVSSSATANSKILRINAATSDINEANIDASNNIAISLSSDSNATLSSYYLHNNGGTTKKYVGIMYLDATPFESFNTTTGEYVLKDNYIGYGPRK